MVGKLKMGQRARVEPMIVYFASLVIEFYDGLPLELDSRADFCRFWV